MRRSLISFGASSRMLRNRIFPGYSGKNLVRKSRLTSRMIDRRDPSESSYSTGMILWTLSQLVMTRVPGLLRYRWPEMQWMLCP